MCVLIISYKFNGWDQIDGTLMPPDGQKQWPPNTNKQDWLLFKGVHGMLMQGTGLINGRGEKWWDLPRKPHKVICTK